MMFFSLAWMCTSKNRFIEKSISAQFIRKTKEYMYSIILSARPGKKSGDVMIFCSKFVLFFYVQLT